MKLLIMGRELAAPDPVSGTGGVGAGGPAHGVLLTSVPSSGSAVVSGFLVGFWLVFGSSFLPAQADVDIDGLSLVWDVLKSPPLLNPSQSGGILSPTSGENATAAPEPH